MMDSFACSLMDAVTVMADFTRKNRFADNQHNLEPDSGELVEPVEGVADDDLLMEQILDNMNNTPIGQVLKKIASLPDVNKQKVLRVRRQLTEGRYDLNERLDHVLEKVLDDLDG
jgi:hypothetical protein